MEIWKQAQDLSWGAFYLLFLSASEGTYPTLLFHFEDGESALAMLSVTEEVVFITPGFKLGRPLLLHSQSLFSTGE